VHLKNIFFLDFGSVEHKNLLIKKNLIKYISETEWEKTQKRARPIRGIGGITPPNPSQAMVLLPAAKANSVLWLK
jgi:hypothetical protein